MEIDQIPNPVREYLREHYKDIDEAREGDSYVFGMAVNGIRRELKVHRNFFMFPDVVSRYFQDTNLAQCLEHGNVHITEPIASR
jgi:hypothetical protein